MNAAPQSPACSWVIGSPGWPPTAPGRFPLEERQRHGSDLKSPVIKGVILAGGLGTRLLPLTKITSKHLLPICDRPMIHWPILSLVEAGITDSMVAAGGNCAGDIVARR